MEPIPAEFAELTELHYRKKAHRLQAIVLILFATVCVAIGETLLSAGMKQLGARHAVGFAMFVGAVTNIRVVAGTALMAVYFGLYSVALSMADITLVLPFTALSYLFVAMMARVYLHEQVSLTRWVGAAIIVIGVLVVAIGMKSDH